MPPHFKFFRIMSNTPDFQAIKAKILEDIINADKSPKGSIDAPIQDVVVALNELPQYVRQAFFTRSICSFMCLCHIGHNKLMFRANFAFWPGCIRKRKGIWKMALRGAWLCHAEGCYCQSDGPK